jgi:hypothetical protein
VSYKAYNTYTDYVNVIPHGNILAVRQHSLPYGGMSAIAVGYAATPFYLSYFFVLGMFYFLMLSPHPFSNPLFSL